MSHQISQPFTQSWIQALLPAASQPITRHIKPCLEWIDKLSSTRSVFHGSNADRLQAAEALWKYGHEHALLEVLNIIPAAQQHWSFQDDDRFLFERRQSPNIVSFQAWKQHLGLEPFRVQLTAEVTMSEWTTLIREEAVRLQKPFNPSAFGKSNTVQPHCQASWEGETWLIVFDDVPWLEIDFEDPVQVSRPTLESMLDQLLLAVSEAESQLLPKSTSGSGSSRVGTEWRGCVASLELLHRSVLGEANTFKKQTQKIWNCIWPVVYREQNLLRGKADLQSIRQEMAECLRDSPKFALWMFVYAKLICQIQTGMGLGVCADFTS